MANRLRCWRRCYCFSLRLVRCEWQNVLTFGGTIVANAQLKLKKALPERLRSIGLDEAWLQAEINRDASLLGLGDLHVIQAGKGAARWRTNRFSDV